MRNHDLVSDAFLALIAASLVLLSSSLLAFAIVSGGCCRAALAYLLRCLIVHSRYASSS